MSPDDTPTPSTTSSARSPSVAHLVSGEADALILARRAIWDGVHGLEKARREEVARLLREYDATVHRPALKALREQCAALGHNMSFTHLGPLGDPWYACHTCGTTECRKEPRD